MRNIAEGIALHKGERSLRIVVNLEHHGAVEIDRVAEQMQHRFMKRFGIKDLMQVQ